MVKQQPNNKKTAVLHLKLPNIGCFAPCFSPIGAWKWLKEKFNLEPENGPLEKEMCLRNHHVHIFRSHILHFEVCSCLWIFWTTLGRIFHANRKHTTLHPSKTQVPRRRETSGFFGQVGPLAECFIIGAIKASEDGSRIQKELDFRLDTSSLRIRWRTPKVIIMFFKFLSYLATALSWSLKKNTSWVLFFCF